MSDTIILYEKCVHGRLEKHNDPAWPTLDDATGEWNPMCPGGKKIVLRQTTIPDMLLESDTTVWVEVSDE